MLHEENEEKERDGGVEESKKKSNSFFPPSCTYLLSPTQSSAHPTLHRRLLCSVQQDASQAHSNGVLKSFVVRPGSTSSRTTATMFQLVRKIITTVQVFIEVLDLAINKGDNFVQSCEIETYFQLR
jgi:hypothetical protein